jgi:cell wall-associated NlpC family hydrolase
MKASNSKLQTSSQGEPPKGGTPYMETWFNTPERIAALEIEAARWFGTPFFPNGDTPGPRGGVSCQKLCSEIYKRAGWKAIEVPEVPMSHARFARGAANSLVMEFMDSCPHFNLALLPVLPGDMLGFRLGSVIHHCGVALGEGMFIHAIDHLGVVRALVADAIWSSRLAAVWRPIP